MILRLLAGPVMDRLFAIRIAISGLTKLTFNQTSQQVQKVV